MWPSPRPHPPTQKNGAGAFRTIVESCNKYVALTPMSLQNQINYHRTWEKALNLLSIQITLLSKTKQSG